MKLIPTAIPDVIIFEPTLHGDHRGFFMETWRESFFADIAPGLRFVQDNHSKSGKGILRGLHYQLTQPQGKLVRVIAGEIYDVAVDIRPQSPQYGQWTATRLDSVKHHQLWIPGGFAHGFLVLSETAEFVYKTTDYYHPESEVCLSWCDPQVAIQWPIPLGKQALLNAKDAAGLTLQRAPTF